MSTTSGLELAVPETGAELALGAVPAPGAVPAGTWVRRALSQCAESIPARSDPRWPFAVVLSVYAIIGFTAFGFNRTPLQMLLLLVSGCALDVLLSVASGRPARFPLSAYITCTSLALLLNYAHDSWVLLFPVLLAVGSKYVFTFQGRHVFNPSLFAVVTSLLVTDDVITTAPAYQWAGGDITLSFVMIMLALVTFFSKVRRTWMVLSFLSFYAIQTGIRAYIMRHHIPATMLFFGTVSAPAFFLFTFYMITDPATSPKTPRGQVVLAFAITVVDLYLHLYESVFTFFYAAFGIAAAKWAFLHGRCLWQRRGKGALLAGAARAFLGARGALRRLGVQAALVLSWVLSSAAAQQATETRVDPSRVHFALKEVPAEHSGLHVQMGNTLQEVDPRILHVAKWVLSVGSSVAVADVNGDGYQDVLSTHTLAAAPHRAQLFLGRGALRFEPVELPALLPFNEDYRQRGSASGATLIDYDGDGDVDILMAVSFGRTRLFESQLADTGQLRFVDVTEASGIGPHHTSIHAGFFDFDRDAVLDLYIANVLPTHFDSFDPPEPLNLFALPKPAYPGDRRALKFMHDGWHDANNGGVNELYRGLGDGHFAAFTAIPRETRWSLAVCYVDLDSDGYTDLYVANDFGPDRVYHNRGGERFELVIGDRYGDLGKDTYKGMNCSAGDVDNDGALDVYVSNVHHPLQAEGSLLWMNSSQPGQLQLVNQATERGALNSHRFGWGGVMTDLDNDGYLDIVQANGMVDDRLDPHGYARKDYWYVNHKLMQSGPDIHTYADMWGDIRGRVVFPNERRRVYLNLGDAAPGYFEDAALQVGLSQKDNSRGVAAAVFDNDGDQDLLISNQHGALSLYENTLRAGKVGEGTAPEGGAREATAGEGAAREATAGEGLTVEEAAGHHFIGIALQGNGVTTHRSALGTRVLFSYQDSSGRLRKQWREHSASSGLSAQSDPRLFVGLGPYHGPVDVAVHWYGGDVQRLQLRADRYHHVVQPVVGGAPEPAER